LIGLRKDIPDLLAAADLFVMPSRNEGLPMALLEAMFAECPVVGTRVGGMPDLLEGGRLGGLVDPEDAPALSDAIAIFLRSREEARSIARLALESISEVYSASSMALRYRELFQLL
jgi:glycosyltransferase involved in cell wall biosynthesis